LTDLLLWELKNKYGSQEMFKDRKLMLDSPS